MQGILVSRFGGPDALSYQQQLPKPEPGRGQVRVRVMASSLNPLDQVTWEGQLRALRVRRPPLIPGSDVAGVIDRVGVGVTDWRVGDEVFGFLDAALGPRWHGFTQSGAWADFAVTRAGTLSRKPQSVSFEVAAALPVAGLTALQGLNRAELRPGDSVMINGASGGVGSFAVQLAVQRQWVVYATASPQHHQALRQLGVHHVIDYHQVPVSQWPTGLDAIYDVANRLSWSEKYARVRKGGSIIDNLVSLRGAWHQVTRGRTLNGVRHRYTFVKPDTEGLSRLSALVETGELTSKIAGCFRLEDIRDACQMQASGKPFGKIVLSTGG